MNRRNFFRAIAATASGLALPYEPERVYSFARELRVPGDVEADVAGLIYSGRFHEALRSTFDVGFNGMVGLHGVYEVQNSKSDPSRLEIVTVAPDLGPVPHRFVAETDGAFADRVKMFLTSKYPGSWT